MKQAGDKQPPHYAFMFYILQKGQLKTSEGCLSGGYNYTSALFFTMG